MYIGLLTARFGDTKDFPAIAAFAAEAGIQGLEVSTAHLPPADIIADEGKAVEKILADTGVRISSLAHYQLYNRGCTVEEYTPAVSDTIKAASILGVDTVCVLAGWPGVLHFLRADPHEPRR